MPGFFLPQSATPGLGRGAVRGLEKQFVVGVAHQGAQKRWAQLLNARLLLKAHPQTHVGAARLLKRCAQSGGIGITGHLIEPDQKWHLWALLLGPSLQTGNGGAQVPHHHFAEVLRRDLLAHGGQGAVNELARFEVFEEFNIRDIGLGHLTALRRAKNKQSPRHPSKELF